MKSQFSLNKIEVGCDEAGRGCLAGPVFAAAVVLMSRLKMIGLTILKINRKRNELRSVIEKHALAWSVAFVDVNEIDEINILNASILAMHRALDALLLILSILLWMVIDSKIIKISNRLVLSKEMLNFKTLQQHLF